MIDPKYMMGDNISLYDIVLDIKRRELTGSDIEKLADEPIVQESFFGKLEPLRRPQDQWNEKYVDELCKATALKCFNREYLLYLDEVAEYVSKEAPKKRFFTFLLIAAVAIAAVVAALFGFGIIG